MLARLGNVVFWLCCALMLLFGVLALGDFSSHDPLHYDDWPFHAIIAGLLYGFGSAVRYVLTPFPKP